MPTTGYSGTPLIKKLGIKPGYSVLVKHEPIAYWDWISPALIVPGVIGFLASLSGEGGLMLSMAVVGATISYALMALSHILLRRLQPDLHRPYKTPGGVLTSGTALILSLIALTGVYAYDPRAFWYTLLLFLVIGSYYFFYSKNHLVARTAAEEFEMLAEAEAELSRD